MKGVVVWGLLLISLSVVWTQSPPCNTRVSTDPSSSTTVPCVFPFIYSGKTYNSCTTEGHPEQKPWCSTKVDSQGKHVLGGGHWGLCGKGCPHEEGCPAGWVRLATGCYRFHKSEHNVDMETAQEICEEYGGYLVEIDSKEESKELQKFYESHVQDHCMYEADSFWIGIKNDTTRGDNGAWISTRTGKPLTFTHWYDNEPNSYNDKEKCASIWADTNQAEAFGVENFRWNDFDCSKTEIKYFKKFNINLKALCERDVDISKEVPEKVEEESNIGKDGCLEGWTKLSTGCYMFKRQPSTFREARNICNKAGGYLVEIDNEEEYFALEEEWKKVNEENECKSNGLSWWMGITDMKEEESWITDYSKSPLKYTAWQAGEPENHGGGVPGEDCAVANLGFLTGQDSFTWYDVPCHIRGFPIDQGRGVSFNPLCEQFQDNQMREKNCEGCEEEWVEVGKEKYKFIKTSDGTTRDEAESICEDNGGRLADIQSEEERKALKQYYENNVKEKSNFFLSALNLLSGNEDRVRYGWWIGATDEESEGHWQWKHSGENLTYSAWYKVKDNPTNENLFSYGGADCAAVGIKRDFLGADIEDEGDDDWREEFKNDDDFKWFSLTCYIKVLPLFNIRMSPLCKF